MKKTVTALLLYGTFNVAAYAEQAPATAVATIPVELSAQSSVKDPKVFCYYDDKAYSIGAAHDGQVCIKTGFDGVVNGVDHSDPLRWISAKDAAKGNY